MWQIRLIYFAFIVQLIVMIVMSYFWFMHFTLQEEIIGFIILINMVFLLVKMVYIDDPTEPAHDKGIVIWWLFCIKFGQRGRYTEKYINMEYQRKKNKLNAFDSMLTKAKGSGAI